jgi:hypothetical protein
VPVEAPKNSPTVLANYNVRTDRQDLYEPGVDHFNIEKKQKVHAEVLRHVLTICRRASNGPCAMRRPRRQVATIPARAWRVNVSRRWLSTAGGNAPSVESNVRN